MSTSRLCAALESSLRTSPQWASDVLNFWFNMTPQQWFAGGPETDTACHKYLHIYEQLAANPPKASNAAVALAAIITLDQLPRNLFRGTARAFATDGAALALTRASLENKFDADLAPSEKPFLYMPLMHSENLADQAECCALLNALADATGGRHERIGAEFALDHYNIIERFGRFPHRNAVLGRENTEAETKFITEHKGFGQ